MGKQVHHPLLGYRLTPQRQVYWDRVREQYIEEHQTIGKPKDSEVMDWLLAKTVADLKRQREN